MISHLSRHATATPLRTLRHARSVHPHRYRHLQRQYSSINTQPDTTNSPPTPTPLEKALCSQIKFSGPVTIAEYMQNCLTHPRHGYYTTRTSIFGKCGDFITAPEISSVFSELLAVWIGHYIRTTKTSRYRLVELGPGTAVLQVALLKTLSRLQCTPDELILVDASESLQSTQRNALKQLADGMVPPVTWHSNIDSAFLAISESPDELRTPTITLAHEFLDALPIHAFHRVKHKDGTTAWRERLVDINLSKPGLRLALSPSVTAASALLASVSPRPDEDVIEVCPGAHRIVRRLSEDVQKHGGIALVMDYGGMQRAGGSVRAIAKHRPVDLLTTPGQCDITADVDFGALKTVVQEAGGRFIGTVSQRQFLLRMRLAARFRVIANAVIERGGRDEDMDQELKRLQSDYDRLVGVSDAGMGSIYKFAAICPQGVETLPGFEDATLRV